MRVVAIGIFVWSLMTAVCASVTNFWQFFAARMGVGEAVLSPAAYSVISDSFPQEQAWLADRGLRAWIGYRHGPDIHGRGLRGRGLCAPAAFGAFQGPQIVAAARTVGHLDHPRARLAHLRRFRSAHMSPNSRVPLAIGSDACSARSARCFFL